MSPPEPRVTAVIVTHDRRDLLLESLAAVAAQTRPPDAVVVVDNASSDGTAAVIRARRLDIELVEVSPNCGGAGGFAIGMARALDDGADLLWLMDDDTVAAPGALSELLAAGARYPDGWPAAIASAAQWTDGAAHLMNTPRPWHFASARARRAANAARCVPIRTASFVSLLVDAHAARASGPPKADYFLWNDDFEFTLRLLRNRIGLLCPASVVVHKTRVNASSDANPGARFFYEVRNKLWTFRAAGAMSWCDRLVFGAATCWRWLRTMLHSHQRRELARAFAAGARAGLGSGPRPNEEVLGALSISSSR